MEIKNLGTFKCPVTKGELTLKVVEKQETSSKNEIFISKEGKEYPVYDDIPDFTIRSEKEEEKREYARELFRQKAKGYDQYQHLSFETVYKDET